MRRGDILVHHSYESFRSTVEELVRQEIAAVEAGGVGRIVMKTNALTDDDLIEQLYATSAAGVSIDLIIRGQVQFGAELPVRLHFHHRELTGRGSGGVELDVTCRGWVGWAGCRRGQPAGTPPHDEEPPMANTLDTLGDKATRYTAILRQGDEVREVAGPPTSTFWCFQDFRAREKFEVVIGFDEPGVIVDPLSQVVGSLTELSSQGVPMLGDAEMEVLNIVPGDGTVTVRGRVHHERELPVRLNLVIVN
jgi:hypothetical protein